jgi:hypothetical protein
MGVEFGWMIVLRYLLDWYITDVPYLMILLYMKETMEIP